MLMTKEKEIAVTLPDSKSLDESTFDAEENKEDLYSTDLFKTYMKDVALFPVLSPEEEKRYGAMLNGTQEERAEALKIFVEHNLRLVIGVAVKYVRDGYALEDAIQNGNIGLMIAAKKFKPEYGFKFSTYAIPWIKQCVQRGLLDTGRTIRIPVHMYERINKMRALIREAESEGKVLTEKELAERLGLTEDDVITLRSHEQGILSLDMPVRNSEDAPDTTYGDFIASPEKNPEELFIQEEMRANVIEALDCLDERSRDIIERRFGLCDKPAMTLEEIGAIHKITRERVRQIEGKALRRLKNPRYSRKLREYVTTDHRGPGCQIEGFSSAEEERVV